MTQKTLIGQHLEVAYVLTSKQVDFQKVGNSFVFRDGPDSIEITCSLQDNKYTLTFDRYIRDVFTSDKSDDHLTYTHHKIVGKDYASHLLTKFLK